MEATCWDVLELDRAAADERSVKRAYACLLKKFRPDRDPEGFQRLNQAFEQAKIELKLRGLGMLLPNGEVNSNEPGSADGETIIPIPGFSREAEAPLQTTADPVASTEFETGRRVLATALEGGRPEEMREAFANWSDVLESEPDCVKGWSLATLEFAERFGEHVLLAVDNSTLLLELAYGHAALAHRLVDIHVRACDTGFLSWFGRAIIEKGERLESHATTGVALRLAAFLASSDPPVSRELLDYCFPRVRGFATETIHKVEYLQAHGAVLAGVFSGKGKQFIGNILVTPDEPQDWTSEGGAQAIQQMKEGAYRGWPGFPLLRQLNTNPEIEAIIQRFESKPRYVPVREEKVGSSWPKWPVYLIMLLALKGIVGLGMLSPKSATNYDYKDFKERVNSSWRSNSGSEEPYNPMLSPKTPPPLEYNSLLAEPVGTPSLWDPSGRESQYKVVIPTPTPIPLDEGPAWDR